MAISCKKSALKLKPKVNIVNMKELGILVFGHTRPLMLADVLESLKLQHAIGNVEVWLDGHQGIADLRNKVELVRRVVDNFDVAEKRYHNGQIGFRKMILQALTSAVVKYKKIIVLEDDCFPTKDAVSQFDKELAQIASDENVFSVYGHPFLMAEENGYCNRFQGWGWATTSKKLTPFLEKLIDCYSISEEDYLNFVEASLTPDILVRLDVTPPRLPTVTLRDFFAWDETLALLTAIERKVHKVSTKRIVYNCGVSQDSSRFKQIKLFSKPPFNMVAHDEVWGYF